MNDKKKIPYTPSEQKLLDRMKKERQEYERVRDAYEKKFGVEPDHCMPDEEKAWGAQLKQAVKEGKPIPMYSARPDGMPPIVT